MPKVGKTSAKKRRRMNKKYRMEKRLKAMLEQQLNSNGGEKPSSEQALGCSETPAVCNETEESCDATATGSVVASIASDTGTVTVRDNEEKERSITVRDKEGKERSVTVRDKLKERSMEMHHDSHHEESSHLVVSHSQPLCKTSHHDEETVEKTLTKGKQCHDSVARKRHVEELHRMIYEGERLEEILKIVKILTGQLDSMKENENQEKGQVGRRHQSQHQHWQLKLIQKFLDKIHEEKGRAQRGSSRRKRRGYTGNQNGIHPIEGEGSEGQVNGHYYVPR